MVEQVRPGRFGAQCRGQLGDVERRRHPSARRPEDLHVVAARGRGVQGVARFGVDRRCEVGLGADRLEHPFSYRGLERLPGDRLQQESEQAVVGVAVLEGGTGVELQHLAERGGGRLVPVVDPVPEEDPP